MEKAKVFNDKHHRKQVGFEGSFLVLEVEGVIPLEHGMVQAKVQTGTIPHRSCQLSCGSGEKNVATCGEKAENENEVGEVKRMRWVRWKG